MNPDQITQLRQLLREAQEAVGSLTPAGICYPLYGEKEIQTTLAKALALLPCPTCNGMGIMMRCVVRKKDSELVSQSPEPCPDCQPKSCVCCEEVTKENAHLHRNCGKWPLTISGYVVKYNIWKRWICGQVLITASYVSLQMAQRPFRGWLCPLPPPTFFKGKNEKK